MRTVAGGYQLLPGNVVGLLQNRAHIVINNGAHETLSGMLFSFLACMKADRVMHIPTKYYHYRARADSITIRTVSSKNVMGSFGCEKEFNKAMENLEGSRKEA